MIKNFPKDGLFLSLFFAFLLLPFAQVKILIFGIPLYLPEIALSAATGFALYSFFIRFRTAAPYTFPDKLAVMGGSLFFLGAILAFITNPFSLTGLGMIKSWFFFPLLGATLVFFEARSEMRRNWFIVAWALGLLATALGSLTFVFFGVTTYDYRVSGVYPSPNFLASFLAPAIFLLAYFFLYSEKKSWIRTLGVGIALALVASVLYFTRSYGVWLALFISLTFFLCMQQTLLVTKKNWLIATGLLFVFALFFLLETPSDKWQALISFEERSSMASRLMIWQAAEQIREDHWFFGIGVGRFQSVYLEYQRFFSPYLEWAVPEPHNLFMAILLATGIVGFFGFCLLVGRFFFLGLRLLSNTQEKEKHHLALTVLSVLIFFLVYGVVDTPYFKNDLALSFWFLLALGYALFPSRVFRKS